ncbi:MAG: histidine kinase [Gammaproteobacteria bacterium HGW-Gammaproteobacteria-4]|jgi:diguanylate cyclase (GGDEF)-like protein|nr:MAG: histidine kinase [Gammaproteobacteria bacterium HGW-Gammaproteobacteria-4]
MRRRLFAIVAIIAVLALLAVTGFVQLAKVARFHELNALHMQATHGLIRQLDAADGALPEPALLRASIEQIRAQPLACLRESGVFERLEITLLGGDALLRLCENDLALADRTLAQIDAYQGGALDDSGLIAQIAIAARSFGEHSDAFIAPVAALGKRLVRIVLVGSAVATVLALVAVLGIIRRARENIAQLQAANLSLAQSEGRNRQLALYDSLTGLPNRSLFLDRVNQAVAFTRRSNTSLALMFVDLDRFKDINDSRGHGAGDALLKTISERLQSVVRSSDTVARLGGDEFAVIVGQVADRNDPVMVALRTLDAVSKPMQIDGVEHQISASIGITLCPQDGEDAATLLKNADLAMYETKAAGRNGYRFYSLQTDENARSRVRTEQFLRAAVGAGQLLLHYHPIVDLSDGHTVGAEALLRWNHPEDGLVFPDSFITLAEETGLICEIGYWVLDNALAQCKMWRAQQPSFTMAVNVSVRQLRDPEFVDHVANVLAKYDIPAASLHVEITESLFLAGEDLALSTLHMLGELGVSLSIDDFGTGYSSFGYLRQLPFRILKIDRSFIRGVPGNPDDAAIASAILSMAQSLGLSVVAEGIEFDHHMAFLRAQSCPFGQGYLFSLPLPAAQFDPGARYPVD